MIKSNIGGRVSAMIKSVFGGGSVALFFYAIAFFFNGFCQAKAATNNAASASFIDVSNAVAISYLGDTVSIPPGTNSWTSTLFISGITLSGSGTNLTFIRDSEPSLSSPIIEMIGTNQLTRLSNMSIADNTNSIDSYKGKVQVIADSPQQWRIDDVLFNRLNGANILNYGTAVSVIDHCTFIQRVGISIESWGDGDVSWSTPPTYGTSNALYIEDCIFTNLTPGNSDMVAFDGYGGSRSVFRHNIVLNSFWNNHGTETSHRFRGTRQFEIYNNTFAYNQQFYTVMDFRSGTGVVFSNTCSGFNSLAWLQNYRSTDKFFPFDGVTGFNPWDSNSPIIFGTNTFVGTDGSQVFSTTNVNWTTNQWVGYTMDDANQGTFGLIVANTKNTFSLHSVWGSGWPQPVFTNGDIVKFYYCYAALDQIGRGSGDLLINAGVDGWGGVAVTNAALGNSSYPREASEPLYAWSNTMNGVITGIASDYPNIQENRDFFNNTPKPNYTPFPYPHPLAATGWRWEVVITNIPTAQ